MKAAKELLEAFTASSFRNPEEAAAMFTEDGTFEMPYLDSAGIKGHYAGRDEIRDFFTFVQNLYPDLDFHDVKFVCETPTVVAGEY